MSNRTSIQLLTVDDLNKCFESTGIKFTYNYGCAVKVYTNKSILYEEFYSNEYLPNVYLNETYYGHKNGFIRQFNTPNQYYSAVWYWLRDFNHKHQHDKYKPVVSFIEVFHEGVFIVRLFLRKWQLCGVMSEEPNRDKCPYIRQPLISDKTTLDWSKISKDSFWGIKRPMYEYLNK